MALAQSVDESHWGVTASGTPTWKAQDKARQTLLNFDGTGTVKGTEFTVGVVRGRTRGGEWGVSFVRKPFKDGSGSTLSEQDFTETRATRGVALTGVEFHWFIPFVMIKERAQIGLIVGGGAATVDGEILETQVTALSIPSGVPNFETQICSNHPAGTCRLTPAGLQTTELRPAKDVMYRVTPLIKLELAGGIILAPGLKLRVAGGLNMPSVSSAGIAVVYLIGAK